MKLILTRVYNPGGTNGVFTCSGKIICRSIELPWKNNIPGKSCIPEGTYEMHVRNSSKFGTCLHLPDVPNREGILIHPANYALTELRGCIAPVLKTISPGKGIFSRKALGKLMDLCSPVFALNQPIYLIIKS